MLAVSEHVVCLRATTKKITFSTWPIFLCSSNGNACSICLICRCLRAVWNIWECMPGLSMHPPRSSIREAYVLYICLCENKTKIFVMDVRSPASRSRSNVFLYSLQNWVYMYWYLVRFCALQPQPGNLCLGCFSLCATKNHIVNIDVWPLPSPSKNLPSLNAYCSIKIQSVQSTWLVSLCSLKSELTARVWSISV